MRCPVCKKDVSSVDKCPQCGFGQLDKTFVNREEAMLWEKEVVIPYRNNHYFSSKNFAIAKRNACELNTNDAMRTFYEVFAGMVENGTWVSAPVNDQQLLICPFRGGHYIAIYSDMNSRMHGESRDVITANINIFIDNLFGNPHLLGFVVDPNNDPILINRKEINGMTVRKDPRLEIRNWGEGIPAYSEEDLMVEEELLDFGIQVIEEHYLVKNGYKILETNLGVSGFPNFALQKDGKLYLMKVDVGITHKPILTERKKAFYLESCRRFNARCLYAPIALVSTDRERAEKSIALCGDGFYANFSGVEEIS